MVNKIKTYTIKELHNIAASEDDYIEVPFLLIMDDFVNLYEVSDSTQINKDTEKVPF